MKRYLFYLIAIICWPLASFGQTHHIKVDMEPQELKQFFYGASILKVLPDGNTDFVGESEGDVAAGSKLIIYPMFNFEGFSLVRWKENGTPVNLEIKASEWGEICVDYTMPDKDVVLTAVYSNGSDNPDDPPLPDAHLFTVSADHYGDAGVGEVWGSIGNVLRIKDGRSSALYVNQENPVPEGDTILIYARPSNHCSLKEWKENETVKQLQLTSLAGYGEYYEYVMPDHDVNLVAYFEKYSHKFKVSADHYGDVEDDNGWGSIGRARHKKNGRNYVLSVGSDNEMLKGDTIILYAQASSQYWKLKEWKENEAVKEIQFTYDPQRYDGLAYDGYYEYLMPDYDVSLVAYFEPTIPSLENPGVNQILGGTLVLNDFKPGGLSAAMPYDKTSFNSIVVMGDMREKDLSVATGTNATTFDLTRTYGFHTIPGNAFSGGKASGLKLEHILLPSCIDSIASAAFDKCASLKQLTILATTPPKLAYNTLTSGVTVKVPKASLALYKAAEVWKNLKIEAITEGVSDLTLLLPDDYSDGRYRNMSIELTNATTGETSKYIVTDNQGYTFRTLVSNTRYTASLKTSGGNTVASIGNIFIDNGNKTLTFANVRLPQDVKLTVESNWKDVTSDVEITWMDASGRFICKDSVVSNIPQGTTLKYSIKLSEELAREYMMPEVMNYQVKAGDNHVWYWLQRIETGLAKGAVTSTNGVRLANAKVRFVQTVNGKYTSITEVTTDALGEYYVSVFNAPTTITAAANGYVMKSINRDDFNDRERWDNFRLEQGGAPSLTISYAFNAVNTLFSDLNNVDFSIYNLTKGKEVTAFLNSYPQILVYEDIATGDELAITVSSLNKSFVPVTVKLKVGSDNLASISIPLKQLGGIDATFVSTTNASVVGILYDSKQQFVQMKKYEDARLSFRELPDGAYTLITMKADDRYNKIQRLGQYGELGLTEGEDYVKNDVNVVCGTITAVENEVIPASGLGGDSYTNTDATYFAVSETTSAIDNYVTVRSRVEFNDEYADGVTSPKLIVDVPDGCDFVEGSVIVGTKIAPYAYEGRRLSVPLDAGDGLVKFCLLPKVAGNYRLGGNAQFSYGGKVTTEPVGTAVFQVKANGNLSFTIPPITIDSIFYASGVASVAAIVKVYVDGELNAQTSANAKGSWHVRCRLDNPANLSTHQVQVVAVATTGESSSSNVQTIQYDQNAIVVESVTMAHYNPEMRKTYEVVFGFNTPSSSNPSYTVYYPKPDYTFSVKLNTVDSDRVGNMALYTLTQLGDTVTLYPVFDPASQTWVVSHTYLPKNSSIDPPVNVAVAFDEISHGDSPAGGVDREVLNQVNSFYSEFLKEVRQGMEEVDTLFDNYQTLLQRVDATQEELDAAVSRLWDCIGLDFSFKDDVQMTDEEIEAEIDSLLGENWQQDYDSLMTTYNDFVSGSLYGTFGAVTISRCTDLTEASLPGQGYEKIITTDSTFVYLLTTEDTYAFVDFVNDKYLRIDLTALDAGVATQVRTMLRRGEGVDLFFWLDQLNIINAFSSAYDSLCRELEKTCVVVAENLAKNEKALKEWEKLPLTKKLLSMGKGRHLAKMAKGLRFADWFLNGVFKSFVKGTDIANATKALEKTPLWAQWAGGLFKSGLSLYALVMDEKTAVEQLFQIGDLYKRIPNPCEKMQSQADALRHRVNDTGVFFSIYHFLTIGADMECCLASIAALPIFETPGFFLGFFQACIDVFAFFNVVAINPFMNQEFMDRKASCELELSLLECNKDKDKDKKKKQKKHKSTSPDAKVLIDPSGYVYEGVASNRLEGVMTTIFYRQEVEDVYGDKHQASVLWDAENYDQRNPLYTDKDGRYEWYVPQGMWQVKYEKDGYQTAYSEWLPVPPPQLDVNQAMVQIAQPEVTMAHCYPTGVEMEFSKYMKPSTLNNENIFLTHAGKKLSGKVIMLNEEKDLKGNLFASKARFVTDEKIPVGEKVQLTVSRKVKSYADMMMPNDFTQEFTIEHEISEIVADPVVRVTYGTDKTMVITATPVEAAKGKTLQVVSGTPAIAGTDKAAYVLDENGQAEVKIKGHVPGSTALLFSIKEYSASAMTNVEVLDPNQSYVAEPKSSIASGSEVTKGQQITLTCETPDAVIYYTLDGSCPCNDTPARQIYSGPITITDNVTVITAMAAAKDLGESDIVTFNYHLHGYTGIDDLSSSVNIYPLVTRSNVNVDLGGQKARSVSVMNVNGVRLFNATNVNEQLTVDLTQHPAGLYIIAVELNNGRVVRKIVKR